MRLKPRDIDAIKTAAREVFGPTATVRLFGSRVDDQLRGGDIDLLIEADPATETEWERVGAFRDVLFRHIDEQKVDVVLVERGQPASSFARVVAPGSVPIT
ncbi:nucleotidyltransferase domain-containing protein [Sphingomonas radiodurans]|uniref:nucleotidyltransferase domain-containing protein n=1 Tax=Sphingomonas radiodurans TaxID=2890321 RepID=UPI001E5DC7EC|nr:nucleotidyltransferase domain-containing protein [Sphingomonas radiodurans]WBH17735.1 nucleotidyltransferase domain-containing protein [Sphingomonas radiodurans]